MGRFSLAAALGTVLLLPAACKPPEQGPPPRAPSDAPPNGKALMGGQPAQATAPAAGGGGMPDFSKAIRVEVTMDAASRQLRAAVHLEPGFHAYGPGEATGKPLAWEVTTPGVTLGQVVIPAGVTKDLGALGQSVVVTGDVTATAVAQGTGPVAGRFNYQVCSDTACDRPRAREFSFAGN